MEAEPHSTLRRLRLQTAASASAGGGASCTVCRVQDVTCSLRWLSTGDAAAAVVALAGHIAEEEAVAVSAAEMLVVLPVVQVSVVVEVDTRPSPAASDGCLLGRMLVTVVVAAAKQVAMQMAVQMAVQVAVQVAVVAAVQVAGLS
ncbi:hypothetical protein NDU88_004956 [Pleurodeles waltl]|uniref:Uncharacterized protein n=1 Tax=Pleurodeles waltl TaxID=8319 RepID=A0AAV7V375_PLEWA|nr:hypothetical protein NDU88_004956 [Pleurodeles waltl]